MNTGTKIETERLLLIPGSNARDGEPFMKMLREDGNFRDFCGVDFSEEYLAEFGTYFEYTEQDECIYSIFPKETDEFIGYVGFHRESRGEYEIEFYISKTYRRKGYCEEACRAVIELLFSKGLSVNGKVLCEQKLYTTTLTDNTAVVNLLQKLGFVQNVSEGAPIIFVRGFVDEETGEIFTNCITQYVIAKEE